MRRLQQKRREVKRVNRNVRAHGFKGERANLQGQAEWTGGEEGGDANTPIATMGHHALASAPIPEPNCEEHI